jgi:predicted tellurium resistance membrane protein TerC
MNWFLDPAAWIGLITLTILEIVLGIDNIVFISILASRLPKAQQMLAWRAGLGLALVSRILLLFSIGWVIRLTAPVFEIPLAFLAPDMRVFSWRDLILIVGGLFLIYKAVMEIHAKLEGVGGHAVGAATVTLAAVLTQIMILDVVFSLDSVITAVGMVDEISIMVVAVIVAVGFMLVFAQRISRFVEEHPTVKILALSFLVLIGVNLMAEGFDQHIPKGYTYFAVAFAIGVEMINMRFRKKAPPVELKQEVGLPAVRGE